MATRRKTLGYLLAALLALAAAAAAGWQLGATPPVRPGDVVPRPRLAILPFDDPDSELDDVFNRALAEAFVVALTTAARESLVVIGPATTAQMMAAGMTPVEVAARADAGFILSGGHRETDHSTFVQLVSAPDGRQLFARRFELDEAAPAIADRAIVEAIVAAIKSEAGSGR